MNGGEGGESLCAFGVALDLAFMRQLIYVISARIEREKEVY